MGTDVAAVLAPAGLALLALAWAARAGRLPSNPFAGIRLPGTTRSTEAWQAAHRAAASAIAAAGAVSLAGALAALLLSTERGVGLVGLAAALGILGCAVVAASRAMTAADRVNRRSG
jgi:uncharacterized membrane protein